MMCFRIIINYNYKQSLSFIPRLRNHGILFPGTGLVTGGRTGHMKGVKVIFTKTIK